MTYKNNKHYTHKESIKEINHIIKNVAKSGETYILTNCEGKNGGSFSITIKETKHNGWQILPKENKTW
ncbi:MAG: hypothetical protein CMC15_15060 [Flavobacteriaceae bacterium]|nr:hypothetical protein [Flavobacteriaceae bacterium]